MGLKISSEPAGKGINFIKVFHLKKIILIFLIIFFKYKIIIFVFLVMNVERWIIYVKKGPGEPLVDI